MIYILIAILAGAGITLTRLINTSLSAKIGIFQSTMYNYITGLAVSTLCLFLSGETIKNSVSALKTVLTPETATVVAVAVAAKATANGTIAATATATATAVDSIAKIPVWAFGGGLLGVIVIVLSSYITPKISAFYFTIIMFIGQLFAGIAIDYFNLNLLSPGKLIGGILVLVGLAFNQYIDNRKIVQA
jgi:transporter family-2 protein